MGASANERLERLRGLLHNPCSEENTGALAELLGTWPDEDPGGREVAEGLARGVVTTWATELERDLERLRQSFPSWVGGARVNVSVRLCGGETERRAASSDDEFVSAVFVGRPERFEAVCVEERRARSPRVGEAPDGVVWLIEA